MISENKKPSEPGPWWPEDQIFGEYDADSGSSFCEWITAIAGLSIAVNVIAAAWLFWG
jgi:hypothetical protein